MINVFLITSTYLVVLTAIIRYFAVASPFRGRNNNCVKYSGFVSGLVFCVVILTVLPQFLHSQIVPEITINSDNTTETSYTLRSRFNQQHTEVIHNYINRIYPLLSSFLPCTVLIFFNIGLIYQLQRANTARRYVCVGQQITANGGCSCRLTVTLILMFTAHVVLVAPSDVVKYFAFYQMDNQLGDIIACVLNLSQACNFALNFILFVSLNSSFRDTFCQMIAHLFGCKKRRHSSSTTSGVRALEIELLPSSLTTTTCHFRKSRVTAVYQSVQLIDSQLQTSLADLQTFNQNETFSRTSNNNDSFTRRAATYL